MSDKKLQISSVFKSTYMAGFGWVLWFMSCIWSVVYLEYMFDFCCQLTCKVMLLMYSVLWLLFLFSVTVTRVCVDQAAGKQWIVGIW